MRVRQPFAAGQIIHRFAGIVSEVDVKENQKVAAGDVLFKLDNKAFRLALDRADAQLGTIRNTLLASQANYRNMQAQIEQAKADLDYATATFKRQQELAANNFTSAAGQIKSDFTQTTINAETSLDNAAFDIKEALDEVIIDVSEAHIWDVSSVAALDMIVLKFRREGAKVELIGMNRASETIVDKLALHDKPGALDKLLSH